MQKLNDVLKFIRRQPRWLQIAAVVVILLLGWWMFRGKGSTAANIPTFTARRGPLEINVLEGGSLQALESQEVKCEVRVGYQGTKILRIVDEGYLVTENDVKTGKVLVELDSSDLQKQIAQQEIQYQQAIASLIDAQQNYEIQLGQNESDVKTAEQKARFARMDFDRFLGDTVAAEIVQEFGLDRILAAASTNDVEQTSRAQQAGTEQPAAPPSLIEQSNSQPGPKTALNSIALTNSNVLPATENVPMKIILSPQGSITNNAAPSASLAVATADSSPAPDGPSDIEESGMLPPGLIDFTKYANIDALGDGEAKQKLRKFEDDLQVAQKELGQAKATLEGTKRLFDKAFVARTEMDRDQLAKDSAELKVQTAETDRDLYLKYEFPKTAEQTLSDYTEAIREFDKARRVAISRLAQARAKLKSAQGQYEVQRRQRNDLHDQLEKCTIHAEKAGLVVYGNGRDDGVYYGNQEPIREGATVRERQAIITIPDMTHMAVSVKIHESYIKKIKKGQKARITVDAFPDKILEGEITKVGVLPDSQNRWMNPDMKVYLTTIAINGSYDWVKPGMSAKVEILVSKLDDVVYIPVQAVTPIDGKQYCYVAGTFKPERREVKIGEFNDEFIEIKDGIREGDRVLLRPPDGALTTGNIDSSAPADKSEKSSDETGQN